MTNSVQSWLNTAGRYPLLPKNEVLRLAKVRASSQPNSKEYLRAINKICNHNLRLIPGVVQKYVNKRTDITMSSEVVSDLLQQGYLGLRRAAEKYEATKGFTFSTYANAWIYQSITRWHGTIDRAIYIPENTVTECLYRRRHGKPSKGRGSKFSDALIASASRSLSIDSIDRTIEGGSGEKTLLSELIGPDNALYNKDDKAVEGAVALLLKDLMAECGIAPRTQDIVLAYASRGRMMIVAAKVGLKEKYCQNLYQEAVRKMKEKAAEKDYGNHAFITGRLSK